MNPDVRDLKAALLRIRNSDRVLLLWDDYTGDRPDALRTFLNLQTLPGNPMGPIVKRVITAWPAINVLGERAGEPLYVECELPVLSGVPLEAFARRLAPFTAAEAREVVRLSGSQPEALVTAMALILNGKSLQELSQHPPLERAYDELILRLKRGQTAQDWREIKDSLVALALVGAVNLGDEHHREALGRAGVLIKAIGRLLDLRTVTRSKEVYSLGPDCFRMHVVRRAIDHQRIDVLAGTAEDLVNFSAPLFRPWFNSIWGICSLATGLDREDQLRTRLLSAMQGEVDRLSAIPFLLRPVAAVGVGHKHCGGPTSKLNRDGVKP